MALQMRCCVTGDLVDVPEVGDSGHTGWVPVKPGGEAAGAHVLFVDGVATTARGAAAVDRALRGDAHLLALDEDVPDADKHDDYRSLKPGVAKPIETPLSPDEVRAMTEPPPAEPGDATSEETLDEEDEKTAEHPGASEK